MVVGHADGVVLGDEVAVDHFVSVTGDEHVDRIWAGAVCRLSIAVLRE